MADTATSSPDNQDENNEAQEIEDASSLLSGKSGVTDVS